MTATATATATEPTRPAAGARRRLGGMDGLRAIAAVTVLIHHTGLYALRDGTSGNGVLDAAVHQLAAGVLLFFTLSGLLLYRPFADAIVGARSRPRWQSFARNRVLRIAPAYWAILLLTGVVFAVAVVPDPHSVLHVGSLVRHPGALLADLLLVQGYHPSVFLTGIGPAWTLVIEVAFYVTLPIVSIAAFTLARRWERPRLVLAPPLTYALMGTAGKLVATGALDGSGGWTRSWSSVLARSFIANGDLFAGGMAIAAVAALVEHGDVVLPRRWRACCITLAAAAIVGAAAVPNGEFTVFRYDQLLTLAVSLLLAVLVLGRTRATEAAVDVLEHRVVASVGVASYSVYLWHQPVIDWLRTQGVFDHAHGAGGLAFAVVLVGCVTGALSTITYRYVEAPALRRKMR